MEGKINQEDKFLLHRADNRRRHDMKMQSEKEILRVEDHPRGAEVVRREFKRLRLG